MVISLARVISVDQQLNESAPGGGATKPLLCTCEIDGGYMSVVVKIMTPVDPARLDLIGMPACNEWAGYWMANTFTLNIPKSYAVVIPDELLREVPICKMLTESQLELAEAGYRFWGTEYLNGSNLYSPAHQRLIDSYSMTGTYLLDVLLLNFDRNKHKPNSLIFKDNLNLIDFEKIGTGILSQYIYLREDKNFEPLLQQLKSSKHVFYQLITKQRSQKFKGSVG